MTVALVAERFTSNATNNSPFTFSPATNCTAGNFLIIFCAGGGAAAGVISAISDNAGGNTWAFVDGGTSYVNYAVSFGYSKLSTAITTSNTITVTMNKGTIRAICIEEFSGLDTYQSNTLTTESDNSGTTNLPSTNHILNSLTRNDGLIVGQWEISTTGRTFTKDGAYSVFTSNAFGSSKEMFLEYKITSTGYSSGTNFTAAYSGAATGWVGLNYGFTGPVASALPHETAALQAVQRAAVW